MNDRWISELGNVQLWTPKGYHLHCRRGHSMVKARLSADNISQADSTYNMIVSPNIKQATFPVQTKLKLSRINDRPWIVSRSLRSQTEQHMGCKVTANL